MSEKSDGDDEFLDHSLHKVGQGKCYSKLNTVLKLNGVSVKFEVETGAELSTIPFVIYHTKIPNATLKSSSVTLRQYDGTVLPTVCKDVINLD